MPRQPLLALAVAALLAAAVPAVHAAEPPSLVVAVDTSRSLQAPTIDAAARLVGQALAELPPEVRVGVLAFDDAPRWLLASGSPPEATQALQGLAPRGNFTLLDDALFTAARGSAPHSIVLLFTDGFDENSATTVEDVARACEARGVRIVAVANGRRTDERTLRRLAMLTGGSYLGRLGKVTPRQLADAATAAPWTGTAASTSTATTTAPAVATAERSAASPRPVPVAVRTGATAKGQDAVTGTASATHGGAGGWWWLALPLGLVALGIPVIAWSRARGRRSTICRRCGSEVLAGEDCARCSAEEAERALQERLQNRDVQRLEDTAEFRLDALAATPAEPGAIEKTRVLTDQSVLLVREPGAAERSYLLRADAGAFAIGRDPRSNTIALQDVALSGRHLKLVPDDGSFYLVDLESTNGTYLNRRRVRASRLHSGDLIHAGQVELEFRSFLGQIA